MILCQEKTKRQVHQPSPSSIKSQNLPFSLIKRSFDASDRSEDKKEKQSTAIRNLKALHSIRISLKKKGSTLKMLSAISVDWHSKKAISISIKSEKSSIKGMRGLCLINNSKKSCSVFLKTLRWYQASVISRNTCKIWAQMIR